MSSSDEADTEAWRINFLLRRDGEAATRAWVDRTLHIYRQALAQPGNFAREPGYRPQFEHSIRVFESWLSSHA